MKRTPLLPTAAALASAAAALLAAAPAPAQSTPQDRATAAADRLHKNNGVDGGPSDLLRSAQAAMRRGQMAEANELLERAETRLLLRSGTGIDPVQQVSDARRALAGRDRAEAMRHTNLAIAALGGADGAGSDAGGGLRGAEGGGGGGGRFVGAVDSGMGGPVAGRAVVRDAGTGAVSMSRAEGVLLAQTATEPATGTGRRARGGGTGAATTAAPPPPAPDGTAAAPPPAPPSRGSRAGAATTAAPPPPPPAPTGTRAGTGSTLPPGDSIPGWSGPAGLSATPQPLPRGPGFDPALGGNTRGGGTLSGAPNIIAGPGAASMTGGEPARAGGAPPGDTARSPGSSGIGGAGIGTSGVGGPVR